MPAVQLAILVLDASGSMSDKISGAPNGATKAWQIEEMLCRPISEPIETAVDRQAVLENCGFIARMQQSQRKDFIDLGIIRFDTKAEVYQDVRPIIEWELSAPGTNLTLPGSPSDPRYSLGKQPFNLMEGKGGGTDIVKGLREAQKMADAYLKHWEQQGTNYEAFVSIILMSDMLNNESPLNEPVKVANEIKGNNILRGRPQVLLAGAAFGDDADENLMKQIAAINKDDNDKPYAIKTTDPVKLLKFFLASASAQLGK